MAFSLMVWVSQDTFLEEDSSSEDSREEEVEEQREQSSVRLSEGAATFNALCAAANAEVRLRTF